MTLKQALLISLDLEELRQIASSLDLPAADQADKKRLVKALLNAPGVTQELLLQHLSVSDLKQVQALCGTSTKAAGLQNIRIPPGKDGPAADTPSQGQIQQVAQPGGETAGRQKSVKPQGGSPTVLANCFVAIDFETADSNRNSACAVALVRVVGEAIVDRASFLIRPPRRSFVFSYLHGITWADVAHAPSFAELWPQILPKLDGASFLAAHNAPFDRSVLLACCQTAGLEPPSIPFRCTVQAARQTWKIYPTRLPDVCAYLNLPLQHHDAASDAEACARIMIAARRAGFR